MQQGTQQIWVASWVVVKNINCQNARVLSRAIDSTEFPATKLLPCRLPKWRLAVDKENHYAFVGVHPAESPVCCFCSQKPSASWPSSWWSLKICEFNLLFYISQPFDVLVTIWITIGGGFIFLNFHCYLGKWSNLTSIFFRWVETTNQINIQIQTYVSW